MKWLCAWVLGSVGNTMISFGQMCWFQEFGETGTALD